ncbi:MAG: hypothetical protein COA78_06965 [Blastopirellula sp.]|nr:MAG: hypothetical protein COA78_06965 [Blastopirellula sp.]
MHTLLTRVKTFLNDANLIDGYALRLYRWTDSDLNKKVPVCVLRADGIGPSNSLIQSPDVLIQLIGLPTTIKDTDTAMEAILAAFRGNTTTGGVVKFTPLSSVRGPFILDNGRPVYELSVRCMTEDQ